MSWLSGLAKDYQDYDRDECGGPVECVRTVCPEDCPYRLRQAKGESA